jgi:phospholipid N-methyltransferase
LVNGIIKNINFKTSKTIVELGPGLGTFTKLILKKAKPDARLFCFEVNKRFCSYLEKNIIDERMVLIRAGAEKLSSNLKKLKIKEADCIVSGLPFLNFSEPKKMEILREVKNSLSDNGKFILFQYTNGLGRLLESHFSKVKRGFVPLNVPPSFIYICEK